MKFTNSRDEVKIKLICLELGLQYEIIKNKKCVSMDDTKYEIKFYRTVGGGKNQIKFSKKLEINCVGFIDSELCEFLSNFREEYERWKMHQIMDIHSSIFLKRLGVQTFEKGKSGREEDEGFLIFLR